MNGVNGIYLLKYIFCIGLFLAMSGLEPLYAQFQTKAIENRVKSKARETAAEQVSTLKSSVRVKVKGTKRALKNSLKGGIPGKEFDPNPTLDVLIEDDEVKTSIYDNANKKRYVELFGEWTTMPSDAEMLARAKLKAIQDSLANLDRESFRVTKNVWDGSRQMIVFGWHPHWMGDIYKSYDYGLFNVVSYYSYDINPDNGGPQNSGVMAGFLASDFVSNAHQKGCSALLSVTCHGEENVMRFLGQNLPAQHRFMDSILYILDSTNADGVEINFEGVNASTKNEFYKFVQILSTTITGARGDTSFVLLSVPAYDPENIFDVAKLQNYVDVFIIKAFTFHETPNGLKKMPPAPLNYSPLTTAPDLRSTVEKYIANLGPLYSSRLVVALPYFGTRWVTDRITEEVFEYNSINYNDIQFDFVMQLENSIDYPGAQFRYDSIRSTYIFSYYDYTGIDTLRGDYPRDVTIFFDDVLSLQQKYRYIIESRLGGVGIQFLGNDSGFDHLRQLLSDEFTDIVLPEDDKLADLNQKSSTMRQNGIYALAVLFYIAIFGAIGFCAALFNRQVRQALFDNKRFRLLYMAFFTLLMLLVGGYMGLFEGTTILLLIGVVFGAIMSWGGWKFYTKRKSLTP